MTILELLIDKGFVEGTDFSLTGEVLTALGETVLPTVAELKAECVSRSDVVLLVNEYLSDKKDLLAETDSMNISNGAIQHWRIAGVDCPTVDQLYDLIEPVKTKMDSEASLKEKLKKGEAARTVCQKVLDLVAGYNLDRQLTADQITLMQANFSDTEKYLRASRPTQAKYFILQIPVDGVLVTQEMKDQCLAILADY